MHSVLDFGGARERPAKGSAARSLAVCTDANGVAQIEMARPAIGAAMIRELAEAFETLGGDPEVRAIVLCGQGDVFSTGVDLPRSMRANQTRTGWSIADARAFARMLWLIESSPKPTIARVHGIAAGCGVGLVCACEVAVAADDATFSVTEPRLGDVPAVMRPYLLSAVGKQESERLASSGTRIDAQQARALGLVQAVLPRSDLEAATKALGAFLGSAPMRRAN